MRCKVEQIGGGAHQAVILSGSFLHVSKVQESLGSDLHAVMLMNSILADLQLGSVLKELVSEIRMRKESR